MHIPFPASHATAMAEFLQELVQIPSPSTHEEGVARRVLQEMERLGFPEARTDAIGNVIGRIGSGRGPKLWLDGHMDTVEVGDPARWLLPPYGGVIQDGVLHGRGACDMKGGLAAMIYGLAAILDAGIELTGDVYIIAVVQEEPCEGLGVRTLIEEEGIRPDYVVLGEPSDLQVRVGHRGRLEVEVEVQGRAAHASAPELGDNAIHNAARLIFGLELLAGRLGSDPLLGKGTLAVTEIESEAASRNAVPDCCRFYIDRRLTLGETEGKALAEIRNIVATEEVKAQVRVTDYAATSYTGYHCQVRNVFPAWAMPDDHALVQATVQSVRETLGYRPRVGRWGFSTDGTYTSGVANIPTVGFGPGEERYAHTVNEQIRLNDVADAARVYARLAVELVGKR